MSCFLQFKFKKLGHFQIDLSGIGALALLLSVSQLPHHRFTLGLALHVVFCRHSRRFLLLLGTSSVARYQPLHHSHWRIITNRQVFVSVINALWSHHQAHHSADFYSLINVFRLPLTQEWLYAVSESSYVYYGNLTAIITIF